MIIPKFDKQSISTNNKEKMNRIKHEEANVAELENNIALKSKHKR